MDPTHESLLKVVRHCQESLDKYTENRNDGKLLHYLQKLYKLPIKVVHLEQTGVGRTVNGLRKLGGDVGDSAKSLVSKWKEMVVVEQQEEEEDVEEDEDDDDDDEDGYQTGEEQSNDSEDKDSQQEKIKYTSSSHRKSDSNRTEDRDKAKYNRDSTSKSGHSSSETSKRDLHNGHSSKHKSHKRKDESEDSAEENDRKRSRKSEYEHKHKTKRPIDSDDEEDIKMKENDRRHASTSEKKVDSDEEETRTKRKKHKGKKSDSDDEAKKKKHKSDKQRSEIKTKKSRDSTDAETSHKSSKKEKSNDDSIKEKEKQKSNKKEDSKKHESSSKTKELDKKSRDKHKTKNKEERADKKPKTVNGSLTITGIDSGSGASFAEALGMCEPSSSSKATSKKKVPEKKERLSPKEEQQMVPKLLKESSIEPLELNLSSLLPTITPNYRPLGNLSAADNQLRKQMLDSETLANIISSKNQRTKVYSGNKMGTGKVSSLFELCTRVLQDNIDALEYTGGVPYTILKPILEKANPNQLYMMEHHNPYLIEDTDELWQLHCQKEFRNKRREELETWREMYLRCLDERDAKLKALTANIKQSQDKSLPVRMTKLAYVDAVAKPPRNIARKQAKHGTAFDIRKPSITPTAKLSSIATSGEAGKVAVPNPGARATERSSGHAQKPKKAPLMLKSISSFKNRFKR